MEKTSQPKSLSPEQVALTIDHTILKPDATPADVDRICEEASDYGFKAVCVNPCQVAHAAGRLKNTGVQICSVIGFPLGATDPATKAFEASTAIGNGATELDMVLNIGALKSGDTAKARTDIESVRQAAGNGVILKVIIETCLLTAAEKVTACNISQAAGADFVKTSTGFSIGGATVADVALMRKTVGKKMGVKASGGVKDLPTALAMLNAGADRIGTSSGVAIIRQARESAAPG